MPFSGRSRHVSWVAAVLAALVGVSGAAGVVSTAGWAAPDHDTGTREVRYHGVSLRVPAGWPVIDLDRRPTECPRLDRHAVYLGAPGPRTSCPPRIVGRTGTIGLRTLPDPVRPDIRVLHTGMPTSMPVSTEHLTRWALESAGVLLTATYGRDRAQISRILAHGTLTRAARHHAATTRRVPEPQRAESATVVPGTFRGYGFDACQAPSDRVMNAWYASSSYRAIGVYIGGGDLGCPDQPNLNPTWVSRHTAKGWHIFPLYVGRQAPCGNEPYRMTAGGAAAQARADADDAARQAAGYGMANGSVIINDMEYYPRGSSCSGTVLTYLSAWTRQLHLRHYRSGVYSSRAAAIDDLITARPSGRYAMPGTINFAQWDNHATVRDPHIPDNYWVAHHRIKQYLGGHNEKHGGVTINIDSDWLDIS